MTFAQTFRLIWIDAVLDRGLRLRRADLCDAFGISVPQASADIQLYAKRFPDHIAYDRTSKGYFRNGASSAFDLTLHHPVITAQSAVQIANADHQP
jgi:hypothetical protein